MSNIYVSEPATNGKIILKTSVGEIEVELWSKEAPLACRNFVQLCMEGYYDDTSFHRLVRGFIVQGGDPTGTGQGGESIYNKPFKTETHSRLSFNRRGLVGMACLSDNQNASQFFFTLGAATELNGKHTLFGKVAGETLFNMLRLGEGEVGSNDKPKRLHRIVGTTVILNPYDDIIPRVLKKDNAKSEESPKVTVKGTKNFSLLSFGEEAEEEEEVVSKISDTLRPKGKSAHDLLSDPRLSSQPVMVHEDDAKAVARAVREAEEDATTRRLRREQQMSEDVDARKQRLNDLREEAEALRREIIQSKRLEMEQRNKAQSTADKLEREVEEREEAELDALNRWEAREQGGEKLSDTKPAIFDPISFSEELAGYKAKSKKSKKKAEREAATMEMLAKFTARLRKAGSAKTAGEGADDNEDDDGPNTDNWMRSQLISEEPAPVRQVLDPSMPHPDRYDLYDPRNPLNIRKRGGDPPPDKGSTGRKWSRVK